MYYMEQGCKEGIALSLKQLQRTSNQEQFL